MWEIAQVGRQLADTLGAARRLHAVHAEPVPVTDGPGVVRGRARARRARPPSSSRTSASPIPGRPRLALRDVSLTVRGRQHGRARRALGRGQDDGREPAAALLGSASRAWCGCPATMLRDYRAGRPAPAASRWWPRTPISSTTRCAPTSCSRAPSADDAELARRDRAGGARRVRGRRCPTGSTRWWASAARGSRAASASAWPSPAPSSRTRRS